MTTLFKAYVDQGVVSYCYGYYCQLQQALSEIGEQGLGALAKSSAPCRLVSGVDHSEIETAEDLDVLRLACP